MKKIIFLFLLLLSLNGYSQKYKYSIFAISTHNIITNSTSMPEQRNLTAFKTVNEFTVNGIQYNLTSMNKSVKGSETNIEYKAIDSRGAKCKINFIENVNLEYDHIVIYYEGDDTFVIYLTSKPHITSE